MRRIRLTSGRYTAVDNKYHAALKAIGAWHDNGGGYAVHTTMRGGKYTAVYMHRLVLQLAGVPCASHTDHRDGNRLNNRRHNLRPTNSQGNARNSQRHATNASGYKGVSFYKRDGTWEARIYANGQRHNLGRFTTSHKAAQTYNRAAKKLHGRFARLNPL